MKHALAHARTHCAPTYGQVRVMPSGLTSPRTLRLTSRGHRAAYGFAEHLELCQCTRRRAAKGAGRINTPGLKPDGRFTLSQNFFWC